MVEFHVEPLRDSPGQTKKLLRVLDLTTKFLFIFSMNTFFKKLTSCKKKKKRFLKGSLGG